MFKVKKVVEIDDVEEQCLEYVDEIVEDENISWNDGRRIVNLKVLVEGLKKCNSCENRLNLVDIIKETRSGYGSWLEIKCACGASNKVATDTTHRNSIKGPGRPIFYINTKISSAMLHTGFSSTTTGRFFNAIGVPALTSKNLKSREREIGVHFQSIASESCKQSQSQWRPT